MMNMIKNALADIKKRRLEKKSKTSKRYYESPEEDPYKPWNKAREREAAKNIRR